MITAFYTARKPYPRADRYGRPPNSGLNGGPSDGQSRVISPPVFRVRYGLSPLSSIRHKPPSYSARDPGIFVLKCVDGLWEREVSNSVSRYCLVLSEKYESSTIQSLCVLIAVNLGYGGRGLGGGSAVAWAKNNKILPIVFNTKYASQISGEIDRV